MKNPKEQDEQGKSPKWKVPMEMEGTKAQKYPKRREANPAGSGKGQKG